MNNILITSAGRRVSLVRFFKNELYNFFPNSKVYTTDANPESSSACRVSDGFFKLPLVSDSAYIEKLLKLVIEKNIKLVIPTIDTELSVLAQNRNLFLNHGVKIVISDFEIVKIFSDKRLTHLFFENININVAKEYDKNNYQLPIYIKPFNGSNSVDNYYIQDENQITDYLLSNENLMFLEYLDHDIHTEYTLDLYFDVNSNLKCLVPRQRIQVRSGEISKGITIKGPFVEEIWNKMKHVEGLKGAITMQVFVNNETLKLYGIEINPRFGGGYPLSYFAGSNYPKWIIQEYLLDMKSIPIYNDWEENLMMLRYDDEVLVHNFKL
jgi:carbamoyl-phosphate synthase large subunit